jgi:D-tyrosyl-tRNA(Tyr) deacylase
VRSARVLVGNRVSGEIGEGFLVLLGVSHADGLELAASFATKVVQLRIFEDGNGKMNRSLLDVGGSVLCVSQFTLYGDVRRGRRPSFAESAPSDEARPVYEAFCAAVEAGGVACQRGAFGAEMQVELVNDGPVTLILDSDLLGLPRRA